MSLAYQNVTTFPGAWATTKAIEKKISNSDQRMLAHVRWEDRVPTQEVRCGVKDIKDVLRRGRLRWYGHVRREDDHVLRRASEMGVEGVRLKGRPRKMWK